MKVLMFGWEFPPYNSGGLGVACWGLTRALSRLGIDVTFVLPKTLPLNDSHCKMVFADYGIPVTLRTVDTLLTPYITSSEYVTLRGKRFGIYGSGLFDEVLRYGTLASKVAQEEEFDVIHAHDWLSFPAGIEAKRVSGKPLVVHIHATEFDRSGGEHADPRVYDVEWMGMHEADRIVAVSEFTKNIIVQKYYINPDKIQVVHNGIDEEDFIAEIDAPRYIELMKGEGKKVVLFVGRITLQKGPDYFVDAAKKVITHYPHSLFVVVGSGDMESRMIEQVASAGLSQHFVFTGFLRGEELASVYQSADVFVMPSVSEPFGITPLEAIGYGVPVIISKQTGVSEVLEHALTVDFWDTNDMADKIIGVLLHRNLANSLIESSKHEVKKIDWKQAARKVMVLYKDIRGSK